MLFVVFLSAKEGLPVFKYNAFLYHFLKFFMSFDDVVKLESSANNLVTQLSSSAIPSIIKRNGPSADPWGRPAARVPQLWPACYLLIAHSSSYPIVSSRASVSQLRPVGNIIYYPSKCTSLSGNAIAL